MSIREFYASIGGDYDDMSSRISNEAIIMKFIVKFKEDDSYEHLKKALEDDDLVEGFQASHTLKGVARNLAFKELGDAAETLTEVLRPGQEDLLLSSDLKKLMKAVTEKYNIIISAINQIEQ